MLGGQQEEGCRVVYHVQREHHQSYLWHHYQNESIQDRQIYSVQDGTKCRSTISHGGTVEWNLLWHFTSLDFAAVIIAILFL